MTEAMMRQPAICNFMPLIVLAISMICAPAHADDNGSLRRFGAKVEISGPQSAPIYAAGAEVKVSGSTPKNVRLLGTIVKFDGRAGDDLWATGADLDLSGEITENVNAYGARIKLNSFVGGSASLIGADILIDENAAIGRKSHASGDRVEFRGASIGRVDLEGREVVFSGSTKAGLNIRSPSVKIADGARIAGNVTIHTIGEPEISDGARIEGEVTIKSLPQLEAMRRSNEGGLIARLAFATLFSLCTFLTGLLGLVLARSGVEKSIDLLVEEPARSGIWGIGGLVSIPLIAVFLVVTVLGTPLAAALLMTLPIIILLSITISGFSIGEWIFNRAGDQISGVQRALSLLAGILLIAIGTVLPYIGGLVIGLAVILGAGALFLLFKERFGAEAG